MLWSLTSLGVELACGVAVAAAVGDVVVPLVGSHGVETAVVVVVVVVFLVVAVVDVVVRAVVAEAVFPAVAVVQLEVMVVLARTAVAAVVQVGVLFALAQTAAIASEAVASVFARHISVSVPPVAKAGAQVPACVTSRLAMTRSQSFAYAWRSLVESKHPVERDRHAHHMTTLWMFVNIPRCPLPSWTHKTSALPQREVWRG